MGNCTGTDPQPDRARISHPKFKIVDEQVRVLNAVYKQPSFLTGHFNGDICPLARYKVAVALVFFRKFFAKAVPWKIREGDVL